MPFRIRRFHLERAPAEGAAWLRDTLDREAGKFGASIRLEPGGTLALGWT